MYVINSISHILMNSCKKLFSLNNFFLQFDFHVFHQIQRVLLFILKSEKPKGNECQIKVKNAILNCHFILCKKIEDKLRLFKRKSQIELSNNLWQWLKTRKILMWHCYCENLLFSWYWTRFRFMQKFDIDKSKKFTWL